MTGRARTAALVAMWLVFVVSSIALAVLRVDPATPVTIAEFALVLVPNTLLIACGTIILVRSDVRLIGWLLALPGSLYALLYALEALGEVSDAAWIPLAESLGLLSVLPIFLLVLVFPTGHLPNQTARWLAWAFAILVVGSTIAEVAVRAADAAVAEDAVFAVFSYSVGLLAVVTLVNHVRLYPTRPRSQQRQLKWFLLAIVGTLVYPVVIGLGLSDTWFLAADAVSTSAWPIAILIAIQRHRLYDIDRIVSRTVAYALVVGVLVVTYAVGVSLVTTLLPTQDELAVAASTIVVVALFNPLRIRLQDVVDRRFNRTRHVAQQVVEQFGRDVAQETDLDRIRDQVVQVVGATVAPVTVSVWQPAVGSADRAGSAPIGTWSRDGDGHAGAASVPGQDLPDTG